MELREPTGPSEGDRESVPATRGVPAALEPILARHAPAEVYSGLDERVLHDLTTSGTTSVHAVVAVGDLRLSGLVLREAVSPSTYARFVMGFTEAVRSLVGATGGWFDKFTGDGFIVFWLYPDEARVPSGRVPEFCQAVIPASEKLVGNLKRTSRNFPVGVGLGLGLDSGGCELVRVGDAVTVVGSPIVGASRMSAGARAGEALANVHFGSLLEQETDLLADWGVSLERAVVRTKEYPDGQEAYRLRFRAAAASGPADGAPA
jgi:class 3 adenylate cyclase